MRSKLEVVLLYNRSNNGGLKKDAELLEKALTDAARAANQSVGKIRHMDPREVPVMCDVIIHLEIPYYSWIPYSRYNVMMINPEWWVSEAFDPYLPAFDQVIFKNEEVKDLFRVVCSLDESKYTVIPWCAPLKQKQSVPRVREFLYLVGGSVNKAAAAKQLAALWKESYPTLHIYTSLTDFGLVSRDNIRVYTKELEQSEVDALQWKYFGHCCVSQAEAFGLSAAEAEEVGAFALLNHNDAYDATYKDDPFVVFLDTVAESNDKTRSMRYLVDDSAAVATLDMTIEKFLTVNVEECVKHRTAVAATRRGSFYAGVAALYKRVSGAVWSQTGLRHVPPVLTKEECPEISVITLVYNRRKFWDLALHNMMCTDYPREKLEWVIVDDSDDMEQSISDKIAKIQHVLPGLNVIYVPYHEKLTIGGKRNLGVKRATKDILLMMDDDDHYPETSFRRRVAYLVKNPDKGCAVCSTIALYDLRTGVSGVNVPPFDLPLGQRISEATLTFRRSFYEDRKFEKISVAEGDPFIRGRELQVVEMMPQQIIVSFCHGSNTTDRRIPPSNVKPSCFWGFPPEFLTFIHRLAGIEVEFSDLAASSSGAAANRRR